MRLKTQANALEGQIGAGLRSRFSSPAQAAALSFGPITLRRREVPTTRSYAFH